MSEEKQTRPMKVTHLEPPLPNVSIMIWVVCLGLMALLTWAWVFKLEEVSQGTGKVIPTSKEQVIQSLEGGIFSLILGHIL